jgi:hypothetical protein
MKLCRRIKVTVASIGLACGLWYPKFVLAWIHRVQKGGCLAFANQALGSNIVRIKTNLVQRII